MDTLITLLTAIFIAVVSSWVTVNLSLRQYHSERWWDRKVNAYVAVLETLHDAKAYSHSHLAALENDSELSEERKEELSARSRKASDLIGRAIDIGSFLLSAAAMERLSRFRKEEHEASETPNWYEHLEMDWKAVDGCLKDMIEIAKKDLRPEPRFLWWLSKQNL